MEFETIINLGNSDYDMKVPVVVTYNIYGKHRPQTLLGPEEHPELEVESILVHPDAIKMLQQALDGGFGEVDIEAECWDDANSRYKE